jgi:hypothetical protein
MTRSLSLFFALLLCLAMGAAAADVTGKWVAQVPGRDGQTRETTFNLKADGEKLTGTISGRRGDTPISDGKVSGDNVSFVVKMEFGGNTIEQKYTGTVSGDEMKLKREGGRGNPQDIVAKRQK